MKVEKENQLRESVLLLWVVALMVPLLGIACLGLGVWGVSQYLWEWGLSVKGAVAQAGVVCLCGGLVGTVACLLWGFVPWGRSKAGILAGLERTDLGEFWNLMDRACLRMGASFRGRVVLVGEANAFASFHDGIIGVLKGDRKLSVGLPLLYGLSLSELEAVLVHELAHFEDDGAMKACALSFEAEGMVDRITHGYSMMIRRWIVASQRVTFVAVLGLIFLAACTFPLRLLFDPLAHLLKWLRGRLYVQMESRADARVDSVFGVGVSEEARASVGYLRRVFEESQIDASSLGDLSEWRERHVKAIKRLVRKKRNSETLSWEELDRLVGR